MPRARDSVVVIKWRDIPAQVNGQSGRDRHQVLLSDKFQRAIDRARRKARIATAQEEVAQWQRSSRPLDSDPTAAAIAEAARLELEYSSQHLGRLAFAGGWERDIDASSHDQDDGDRLAALEELKELDEPDSTRPGQEQSQ